MSRLKVIGFCSLLLVTHACSSNTASTPSGGGAGTAGAGASGTAGTTTSVGAAGSAGAGGLSTSGIAGSPASSVGGVGGTATGAAGSAGSGSGNGGASGSSAGGSAGNAAGNGGGSSQAGSGGGAGQNALGFAVLSVPLAAATDKAHFVITLASPVDLHAATITFHVNVHAGTGGVFQAYLQHGGDPDYNQFFQGWQTLSALSGWQDIAWAVGTTANPESFDESQVARLGIEIGGGNAGTLPAATTAVVYVDSIKVSGGTPAAGPWTFDSSASVSATPNAAADTLWLNAATSDTTAIGATATWLSGP